MSNIYTDSKDAYAEKRRLVADGKFATVVHIGDNKFAVVVLEAPKHIQPKK